MKVHILEVSNVGKCYHYQAVFNSFELAEQAKRKYLNDPSCNKKMMTASITTLKLNTNLDVLNWIKEIE